MKKMPKLIDLFKEAKKTFRPAKSADSSWNRMYNQKTSGNDENSQDSGADVYKKLDLNDDGNSGMEKNQFSMVDFLADKWEELERDKEEKSNNGDS